MNAHRSRYRRAFLELVIDIPLSDTERIFLLPESPLAFGCIPTSPSPAKASGGDSASNSTVLILLSAANECFVEEAVNALRPFLATLVAACEVKAERGDCSEGPRTNSGTTPQLCFYFDREELRAIIPERHGDPLFALQLVCNEAAERKIDIVGKDDDAAAVTLM